MAYLRDEESYKKLFYHFHIPLYRFAKSIVCNGETADEVVSDTLMKIWTMGSKLAQVDYLREYLFTCVKNAALTCLAKTGAARAAVDGELDNLLADVSADPESRMIALEVERRIEESVNSLPTRCQLVYRLVKEEGFSHKKVCSILEISINTVETQMRIALKKIRLSLEDYLEIKNREKS